MAGDEPRRLVCIGKIVGVWGVDGWLKVYSYTRHPPSIFEYGRWYLETEQDTEAYELETGREQGRGLVARLRGVADRTRASALVGARILVGSDQLPPLREGEFFWHQLEGLAVTNLDGAALGTVDHLLETGANDVMVVTGDRERLIPYTDEVVKEVDLEAGTMKVDWDAGFQ